ncbi:hypothetical protein ACI2K4_00600 [Micromonospora sp. NPDC050397]|uniref:hypothetical protein n=1 Tax=Micromonospora sp. NPDC050397 TaxID=3364279 RepID=UPI00384ADB87
MDSAPVGIDHPEPTFVPVGDVAAGSGSTRSGPAGVPLGFAHSTGGAVAASTAWLTVIEGSGVFDVTRRLAVLSAIGDQRFATAASERIAARLVALGLPPTGTPQFGYVAAVVRPELGAYRVLASTPDTATVQIWYPYQLAVLEAGVQPSVAARWMRAGITLRWDTNSQDWRLTSDLALSDGPDPGAQRPSSESRARALGPYGSGWHTYAEARR